MSELAYNINGESFDLPATATGWRVRRMKPRGAPEVVYGRDGVPLSLPIDAELEDLRRAIETPGRFRLDAIDDRGKTVPDLPAAYVIVPNHEEVVAAPAEPTRNASTFDSSNAVVAEAMRLNTELARAVVDRFPMMVQAAAELLRAADGAGLPARPGMATTEDDDDEGIELEQPAGAPGFDLNGIVASVASQLVMGLVSGKTKLPALGEVLDWRKAARPKKVLQTAANDETAAPVTATPVPEPAPATTADLPPIDPKMMQHFVAIQAALTPDEARLAREVATELSPAQLREWIDSLGKLSVPDAVGMIRGIIRKGGGAS